MAKFSKIVEEFKMLKWKLNRFFFGNPIKLIEPGKRVDRSKDVSLRGVPLSLPTRNTGGGGIGYDRKSEQKTARWRY
ncbi:MAG: hypothetical protein FWG82_01520 [Oscillospiraceae bacterium]|nr:hypothetical protein [Oscillospiraceae bacterium]